MTLIKKSDVKAHLSLRRNTDLRLVQQVDNTATAALPVVNMTIESRAPVFKAGLKRLSHPYLRFTRDVFLGIATSESRTICL
jgi:hypothetical protein